ncbi:Cation/H(+) antiporter 4 [Heracleum sosnowskyi]|uniref:Cation/H(+) antiporter 4 n=1 Tax=Heracleum sosnowskyi TaxID=360622 RepID=A0AAD8HEU9_9APIA|nr:Cation/H(+) antiporter 4 [Heracleum sosnowskyi]
MDLNEFLREGVDPVEKENCAIPIKVQSPGWFILKHSSDYIFNYSLPRLLLQLSLIFILTHSLHVFLRRLSLPRIISKILAGVILGKTVFGNLSEEMQKRFFPEDDVLLYTLSRFGFIFYMFMVGVKMDLSMIWKIGRKAITIGLGASFAPMITACVMWPNIAPYFSLYKRTALSTVIRIKSVTAFPVIASLLVDLKIMNTEIGRLSLAAALVADLVGKVASIALNVYRIYEESSSKSLAWLSFFQSSVVITSVLVGTRPWFSRIIRRTPEGKPVKQEHLAFIYLAILFTAFLCTNIGLQDFYIPFLLGLAIPNGPPLGSTLAVKLDTFTSGLLAPLLISNFSLWIDLTDFYDIDFLKAICMITVGGVAIKIVFVLGPALLNNLPIRDAVTISIILSTQGIVQGAYYDMEYRSQNIDGETFSLVIIWTAILAAAAHLSVKYLYDYSKIYRGYVKRNILNTSRNSQLRLLVCSQRSDDAVAAMKLLEATSSIETPTHIYALNLVELVGQATPLIINHGLGQKNSSGDTLSRQIVHLWQNFEQQYCGSVSVQAFTSISLPRFMHFDVCSVAFDYLTSLIILPFHRKWNQHGKIIFENNLQRTINQEVLGAAPCSVGILVDRRKTRTELSVQQYRQSRYHVAVIFLGDDDDREALAYAMRMANSTEVQLTVVRLIPSEVSEEKWESVLDREIMRELKTLSRNQNNIIYREKITNDGGETALIVNSIADSFDLILVGRRHREDSRLLIGLSQWNDIPELGPIGDILASAEINRPASVLVVQQQEFK